MQLPPVGLANISGSTAGTEKPWAVVQKPSASIALPPQSRAGAFPMLVQDTIQLKLRGGDQQCCSGSQHLLCSILRNAAETEETPLTWLKRHWICLALSRSAFLPLSSSGLLGAIICAQILHTNIVPCCPQALQRVVAMQMDDVPCRCGMRDSSHQEGGAHSILYQAGWGADPWVSIPCVGHTQYFFSYPEFAAISEVVLHPAQEQSPAKQKNVNVPYLMTYSSSSR